MAERPVVFISTTSADLRTARDLVAKLLISLGYDADWQDINPTHGGNLLDVLRSKVDRCRVVVQLVGGRYGEEPPEPVPPFGRVSYTQFEALYAEAVGKKVVYILLPPEFPTDQAPPESPERASRQEQYRNRLKESGALYHQAGNLLELENRVLRLRDELGDIRRELQRNRRRLLFTTAVVLLLLSCIGIGVFQLYRMSRRQEVEVAVVGKATTEQKEVVGRIEAKVDEIRKLPQGRRLDRLANALASADGEELEALSAAGVRTQEIESVLIRKMPGGEKTIAREFFENGRNAPAAVEWLKGRLSAGLNPNLLLPHPYYEQRAILADALQAGNAPAVLELLAAGAAPHAYQDLWLTAYPVPSFLFPYTYLADNERLTEDEKRRIAEAYQRHGAALFKLQANGVPRQNTRQLAQAEEILDDEHSVLHGVVKESPPSIADSPLGPVAELRTGVRWSEFAKGLPRRVESTDPGGNVLHFFETRHFLGEFADQFYFLGQALELGNEYALVQVSKDRRRWNVFVFMGPQAGMGIAKELKDGFRPDDAWRRFDFTYQADKGTMRLSDYHDWKVVSTWP
jgi:hypothetical protein